MSVHYIHAHARFANYYMADAATAIDELSPPTDAVADLVADEAVLCLSDADGDGLLVQGSADDIVEFLAMALQHAIARRALMVSAPQPEQLPTSDYDEATIPPELVAARDAAFAARIAGQLDETEVA